MNSNDADTRWSTKLQGHISMKNWKREKPSPRLKGIYQYLSVTFCIKKLDRAIPDSIGYYFLEGLNVDDPIQKSRLWRYKNIFFFERITFEKDTVRSEDDRIATALDGLLKKSYQMLGYEIISVPLMTIEDRVDFILTRISHEESVPRT